jgi:hypothetical protein
MPPHFLAEPSFAFGPREWADGVTDIDAASRNQRLPDDSQRLELVVEVVQRVVEDSCVEAVAPRHLSYGDGVEFGHRVEGHRSFPDVGDTLPRDLDHVLGDIEARHPVTAAGEKLAEPAGATANVENLCPNIEAEVIDEVGERMEALRELEARWSAKGLGS